MLAVQEYLQTILPSILAGLADDSEGVRNAALAAGRTFVEFYAQTSLPLLLPTVEQGIVNDNWRIRQSSIDLLGDLLFKVKMKSTFWKYRDIAMSCRLRHLCLASTKSSQEE